MKVGAEFLKAVVASLACGVMILQTWGGEWHTLGSQEFQGFLAFLQRNGPEICGMRPPGVGVF